MSDINEIDKRLSILETEFNNMELAIRKLDDNVSANSEVTLQIKTKLDRQNGAIPHISDAIKIMSQQQIEIIEKIHKKEREDAKLSVKLNILWAISAIVASGVVAYILNSILR